MKAFSSTLIPKYSNSMHQPWLVLGRTASAVNLITHAIKSNPQAVDPEDVTFYSGDDHLSDEIFSEESFTLHATGILPLAYSSVQRF